MEELNGGIYWRNLLEEFIGGIQWRNSMEDTMDQLEHGGISMVDIGTHYTNGT